MNSSNILITESDQFQIPEIFEVHKHAFGSIDEAVLTKNLINDPSASPIVSLLAMYDNKIVGHIIFTKATFKDNPSNTTKMHILAPLAVLPEYQNKGVGGMLINNGILKLRDIGCELVFVLGHINYYPKYGFTNNAANLGFPAPYPIPSEVADAWMLMELKPDTIKYNKGQIACCKAMDKDEYWKE